MYIMRLCYEEYNLFYVQVHPPKWSEVRARRCGPTQTHGCNDCWCAVVGGKTLFVHGWCQPCHTPWHGGQYVFWGKRPGGRLCYFSVADQTNHSKKGTLLHLFEWFPRQGYGFMEQAYLEVQVVRGTGRGIPHGLAVRLVHSQRVDGVQLDGGPRTWNPDDAAMRH